MSAVRFVQECWALDVLQLFSLLDGFLGGHFVDQVSSMVSHGGESKVIDVCLIRYSLNHLLVWQHFFSLFDLLWLISNVRSILISFCWRLFRNWGQVRFIFVPTAQDRLECAQLLRVKKPCVTIFYGFPIESLTGLGKFVGWLQSRENAVLLRSVWVHLVEAPLLLFLFLVFQIGIRIDELLIICLEHNRYWSLLIWENIRILINIGGIR